MKEKIIESLVGLKVPIRMLISEISFYNEMLKLTVGNEEKVDTEVRHHVKELLQSAKAAKKLLDEVEKRLSFLEDKKKQITMGSLQQ